MTKQMKELFEVDSKLDKWVDMNSHEVEIMGCTVNAVSTEDLGPKLVELTEQNKQLVEALDMMITAWDESGINQGEHGDMWWCREVLAKHKEQI